MRGFETFFLKHVTRERAASRLQERVDVTGRKPVGGDGVVEESGSRPRHGTRRAR